jgi:hypothetical protein
VKFRAGSDEGLAQKVFKAAQSGRLDGETAKRYVALLLPYWQKAVQQESQIRKAGTQESRLNNALARP